MELGSDELLTVIHIHVIPINSSGSEIKRVTKHAGGINHIEQSCETTRGKYRQNNIPWHVSIQKLAAKAKQ